MSGLDLIYENMQVWMDKLPNIESIRFMLIAEGMQIRISWFDDMMYTYTIPKSLLDAATSLDAFGDMILSEAERAYKLHTVGEE